MCGYFCIGFIDFILKSKSLLEYENLFSPNAYEKNNKIVLKFYCVICSKYRKFESPKISDLLEKTLVLSLYAVSVKIKIKNT